MREECSVEELERTLRGFVTIWPACPIGPLKIDLLGGFFALVPVSPIPVLRGFASHIVRDFDHFRASMNQAELQRRLRSPLDESETTYLVQWGYPYVFDRFRFHMTLTDPVPIEQRAKIQNELEPIFHPLLTEDFSVDALSLFVQEDAGANFVVRSQFALGSRTLIRKVM